MRGSRGKPKLAKEQTTQVVALCCLLTMGGLALAGPSGVLAWSENNRLLKQREHELQVLIAERDELRNRVALLDPNHVDPDIAGELVRRNLNVVHPDEMVMLLDK
ncbi:septum formation initiator [Novosphingobium kunmingense]|uniref:Septum formation initiator n=1 Tax=Novosphingobium kunmingense TaxID=1211806 RepID=A0A2N0I2U2_9SPHN|nr:septum formation initiator family protein [Novosphingobium kunmingense]PKB25504.1 septum formation initiator [Novosphingobium kunmingense]